jgi:hypothetical protein
MVRSNDNIQARYEAARTYTESTNHFRALSNSTTRPSCRFEQFRKQLKCTSPVSESQEALNLMADAVDLKPYGLRTRTPYTPHIERLHPGLLQLLEDEPNPSLPGLTSANIASIASGVRLVLSRASSGSGF